MRVEAWLTAACLASSAAAVGPAIPGKPPARPDGKPEPMKDWKWTNPFEASQIRKFDAACSAERTFQAKEFLLDDVSEPPPLGLKPYFESLKSIFANHEYPGSWDGIDPHGYDRNLLMMEYADVPIKVREWIEEQERSNGPGKGLFAVYERPPQDAKVRSTVKIPDMPIPAALRPLDEKKVVIFAPGALYEELPLWVAEESECAGGEAPNSYHQRHCQRLTSHTDTLLDTGKYSAKLADGGVVAYPVNKTKAKRSARKREIEFTIKAQVLKAKAGVEEGEDVKEEVASDEAAKEAKKDEL